MRQLLHIVSHCSKAILGDTYKSLDLLHGVVLGWGGRRSRGSVRRWRRVLVKIILHLSVELLCGLWLGTTGVAAPSLTAGVALLFDLCSGDRLRLGLWETDTSVSQVPYMKHGYTHAARSLRLFGAGAAGACCASTTTSIYKLLAFIKMDIGHSYLDRAFVNEQAVQLSGSLGGGIWVPEDNGGNPAAGAVLVVGQEDLLHRASGLVEVFLSGDTDQYFVDNRSHVASSRTSRLRSAVDSEHSALVVSIRGRSSGVNGRATKSSRMDNRSPRCRFRCEANPVAKNSPKSREPIKRSRSISSQFRVLLSSIR